MKLLAIAILLTSISGPFNVAKAQFLQSTFDSTGYSMVFSLAISSWVNGGKMEMQQVVEDAGTFLAINELTPQLEELLNIVREQNSELKELSDRELVKLLLRSVE